MDVANSFDGCCKTDRYFENDMRGVEDWRSRETLVVWCVGW